jgi:Ca2+-binding RTX toxin-like protein
VTVRDGDGEPIAHTGVAFPNVGSFETDSGGSVFLNLTSGSVLQAWIPAYTQFQYMDAVTVYEDVHLTFVDGLTNAVQVTHLGTASHDEIDGTTGPDVIIALGGNDIVNGRRGEDLIISGSGDDHVDGRGGDDVVFAGSGDDEVFGRGGADVLRGGPGADRVEGNGGDDQVFGGPGSDTLLGGRGHDVVQDTSPRPANAVENNVVDGGSGNDRVGIIGASGSVLGRRGDDSLIVGSYRAEGVTRVYDCGSGVDVAYPEALIATEVFANCESVVLSA